MEQWSRIRNPDTDSQKYTAEILTKVQKQFKGRKTAFPQLCWSEDVCRQRNYDLSLTPY
jgi:hypothetical protein